MQKVRAVFEQKVELVQAQLEESLEREESLKKVQEKMIRAFNPSHSSLEGTQ